MAIAFSLWIAQPIAHGHSYQLSVRVSAALGVIWFLYRWGWRRMFSYPRLLLVIGAGLGLYLAAHRLLMINPDAEIVHGYRSLFAAIDSGQNPYTCLCIFHRAEFGVVKFGNFNYLPMEIWPYYLAFRVVGQWTSGVLTVTLIILQLGVCALLFLTFKKLKPITWIAFCPLFIFFELFTNVATSFVFVAMILLVIQREEQSPKPVHRYLLALLFGAGLLTKFFLIPLFAAYYWRRLVFGDRRSYLWTAAEAGIALAVSALLMMPFGAANVIRGTIGFNLALNDRAAFTTFYPNVLSGLLTWIGQSQAYPLAAVSILGFSVFISRWLTLPSGFLLNSTVFLFVSPTPEPQFIPVVAYIALAGRLADLERWPALSRSPTGRLRGNPDRGGCFLHRPT